MGCIQTKTKAQKDYDKVVDYWVTHYTAWMDASVKKGETRATCDMPDIAIRDSVKEKLEMLGYCITEMEPPKTPKVGDTSDPFDVVLINRIEGMKKNGEKVWRISCKPYSLREAQKDCTTILDSFKK